ncbi:MAG: prolyl oligopeptidase family serine peptidase [Opitutaceae bacterium]|nr:prolyl oligopeptidase family serine peptidase [Opitutaceae bacterium]
MTTQTTKFLIVCCINALVPLIACAAEPAAQFLRPVVSEEACPLVVIEAPTRDNHKATAVIRTPPGNDRRPAIVFLHGGLGSLKLDVLKKDVLFQPNQCRFLAAGYVTVAATFRPRSEDPQTRDALIDCLAVIDYVKKLPRVDPKSVVVFGGSGGGSLAMELAGETELCAVAGGEPANVLFTGMMNKEQRDPNELMDEPRKHYTPELRKLTEAKISKINCPVLIVHSNLHPINNINNEIVIPAMRAAGKYYEIIFFPEQQHGFYNGYVHAVGMKVYDTLSSFYLRHIATKPKPIDSSLIKFEPVVHPGPRVERDPSAKAKRAAIYEKAKQREKAAPQVPKN